MRLSLAIAGRRRLKTTLAKIIAVCAAILLMTAMIGCGSNASAIYVVGTGTPEVQTFHVASNGTLTADSNAFVSTGAVAQAIVLAGGQFAYVANSAGNTVAGAVSQYQISRSSGAISTVSVVTTSNTTAPTAPVAAGLNPVALAADPAGKFLFAANQASNNISAYSIDGSTGALTAISGSPFATAASPGGLAAQSGLLFVTHRGSGQISVFKYDASSGVLSAVSGSPFAAGTDLRGVAVDPSGKFLYAADQAANAVVAFSIQSSGQISAIPGSPFTAGTTPVSVKVHPSGKFLYAANFGSNNVSVFAIGSSGGLTAISGSPFAVDANPSLAQTNDAGKLLFVANQGANTISVFIVTASGALQAVDGSPFKAGAIAAPVGIISLN
jgi:6-phosphogluconolactonase (cycloisomerase 2 family)